MIVGMKDIFKMIGIIIISACAVFVCTLFLNFNIDIRGIEHLLTTPVEQGFYDAQILMGKVICGICGGCLLATSVVVLCFYIKHYIDSHRKELGILKAIGYSNFKIAGGFWVFGLNIFAGTGAGYMGAHLLMPKFYQVQNEDNILPEIIAEFHPALFAYLVLLPTLFFAIVSICYGCSKMGMPVMDILRGKSSRKIKAVRADNDLSFLEELRKNTVRQRKSLVFFIAFSSFCYAAMLQMTFSIDELASVMMKAIVFLVGIILSIVTLLLATTTVVRSNSKNFAMMKAFGYSSSESAKAVLNGYRPIAYIGFFVGTIYQYMLFKIIMTVVFRDVENLPEYEFDVQAFFIVLISFLVLYEIIIYAYTKKIGKVSIKEIMLDGE